ncbi:MAG: hypothetical protein KA198_02710 [Chitinophagaceae bacterium]|nr:hypothetical protein [Chitinophagaceae bacterium]
MKYIFTFLVSTLFSISYGQNIEEIVIPKGVTYNYCDAKTIEEAKKLISENISDDSKFTLAQNILIVGPQLWNRYKNINRLSEIEGGNTTFHVDNLELKGKMTQDIKDAKKVWDEFRKEVKGEYKIRKANEEELKYYWSVISFDIDEPLLIVETKEHNYILNILKEDLKLMWLDEAPKTKGYKTYQNGEEVTTISKGEKETKLEKIFLLSDDATLKKNTSVEELSKIVEKCSKIFEELFKTSTKEGKIIIKFELNKKQNKIEFALKNDIDLDIMKEFEKRINAEVFPNSKKDPIQFQILFKVNSYNETE